MRRNKIEDTTITDISDELFDSVASAITTNKKNYENQKIKYVQWTEQDDYILEQHGITKKQWLYSLNKRAGIHNRVEKNKAK